MNRSPHETVPVEVCIDASSRLAARRSAAAAFHGGATRVEVCSDMSVYGLTPPQASVAEVRRVFGRRRGVLVMIRPRPGDFVYSLAEQTLMRRDLEMAVETGADGVVFGALSQSDSRIDVSVVRAQVQAAKESGVRTVFHRAFDAVPDRREALEMLIDCGVNSVLTAGIPWGAPGTALDGLETLEEIVRSAAGRIEVVIGGGIGSSNVKVILSKIRSCGGPMAVHSYSGVLTKGTTSLAKVRELVSIVSDSLREQSP